MKKHIVVRTSSNEFPIVLEKNLSEGYIVVICNPIGNELEYILERETKDSQRKDIGAWIIHKTEDKYHYICPNCNHEYRVVRKVLGNSYGDEYKYAYKYCSECGMKMENIKQY